MFKNYVTTTLRNFRRHKANTLINIAGLALSISCCIFIYAFVRHEYTFDNFHRKADRIYRIVSQYNGPNGLSYQGYVTFPLANALRQDFPDLEYVTLVYNNLTAVVKTQNEAGTLNMFEEDEMAYADEYFLETFDYEVLASQPGKLLATPEEVVLTQKLADKFFGRAAQGQYETLIGQTLLINKNPYRISAILQDIPRNTNVTFQMLLPLKAFERLEPQQAENWYNTNSNTYAFVTLSEQDDPARVEKQLVAFTHKYFNEETASRQTYYLQPLTAVHTDEQYEGTLYAAPRILIIAFVTMGLIVLLTACINFVNLATAQSVKRAKEIGIRKTLGSLKYQLIIQFMGETFLLTILASLVAFFLADWFAGVFNQYLSVVTDYGLTLDISILYFLLGLSLFITLLAGYYPAQILASYRPVEALKQSISQKNTGFAGLFSLRKTLVVAQFVISQLLIIGTLVVAMQMHYFRNLDLGFAKEGIMVVFTPGEDQQKLEVLRNELMKQAPIQSVSFNSGPPTSGSSSWTNYYAKSAGDGEKYAIERKYIDPEYLSIYEVSLLAGRSLREEDKVSRDSTGEIARYHVLLNEKATKLLGYSHPEEAIGQVIITDATDGRGSEATIVGVTENFANAPLQQEVHPCMLVYSRDWVYMTAIKMNLEQKAQTSAYIQSVWEALYPDQFYEAMLLDEYFQIEAFYLIEDIMYQGFKIFSLLSIFIGCLGLYGLVAYLSLQRQKEIGIRKVLGASVAQIMYLFTREFLWLVVLAFIIAAPLGYFAMQAWLESFAHRIELHLGYFALALLTSVGIAWITVGYKSIKTAITNPVESLRSE